MDFSFNGLHRENSLLMISGTSLPPGKITDGCQDRTARTDCHREFESYMYLNSYSVMLDQTEVNEYFLSRGVRILVKSTGSLTRG